MLLLVGNWWTFVLRGVVAILFGLLMLLAPAMGLLTLIFLFGFYALADGLFNVIAAFRRTGGDQQPWWALLIEGLFSIIAGLVALLVPGLTALVLLYIIAFWAFATGAMEIAAAIRLRRKITGEWALALSGALSILIGLILVIAPGAGALAMAVWIGVYALIFGALLITLGLNLRRWVRDVERHPAGFDVVAPGH